MPRSIRIVTFLALASHWVWFSWAQPTPTPTPTTKWIYLAPDDHTDYFWSADEVTYKTAFLNMLDYYLDQADATDGEPSEFQSRWNCDGSFWLWTYEQNKPPADFERLMARVADGHINAPLNGLSVTLGGAPAEAILRGMYYPGHLERRYGVRFRIAMAMENQTMPYGIGGLWAGSGAKYCWQGICDCNSDVTGAWDRQHDAYWWNAQDGSRLLVKWNSQLGSNDSMGGYAEARNPTGVVDYVDTNTAFKSRYPYSVIGAFGQGWDDTQTTNQAIVDAAIAKTTSQRKVIVSNEVDFFTHFEDLHGVGLPTLAVSFGNDWDLYCAAMAEVSARVKRAVEKLRGAEAMATLVSLHNPIFMNGREAARDLAWMDLGIFWEHNWGVVGLGSTMRDARIAWQKRITGEIESYVNQLYSDAATTLAGLISSSGSNPRFFVFNPLSWTRTDMADLAYTGSSSIHVVDLATGQEVPWQIVTLQGTTFLRILAPSIPPVGYKVFEIVPGVGTSFSYAATTVANTIDNATYTITLDGRGAITSLIDKTHQNRQFADTANSRYLNDWGSGSGTVSTENAGPVSVTLLATTSGPPARTTRVTLVRDSERIDIQNDINANFTTTNHWSYGFNISTPDVWHEEAGAVIRAKLDTGGGHYSSRTNNSRYDYLTLNHFANMTGGGYGVTLSNADCYFMKLGNSTIAALDTTTPQIHVLAGGRVAYQSTGIPDQGGDTHFLQRFALQTHTSYDPAVAMKISLEHQNPLIAGTITPGGVGLPADKYSLVQISDPNVLLWTLKPAEEGISRGIVARLWNLSSSSKALNLSLPSQSITSARHISHIETDEGAANVVGGQLAETLQANQMKSFLLVPGSAGPTPTPSSTSLVSNTPTRTRTPTGTNTFTVIPTLTQTRTSSFTTTFTGSPTPTRTNSITASSTNTATRTGTSTSTSTITSTPTPTGTNSFTPSSTSTPTRTGTNSFTPSITSTPTHTGTNSFTPSITSTPTHTGTNSFTPSITSTPTHTGTNSFTPSITSTPTRTGTNSFTPSTTSTPTRTVTNSFTPSITRTPTRTGTNSFTPSVTSTPTRTGTNSFTPSVTSTPTRTGTNSFTPSVTSTPTRTGTNSFTPSITSTPTRTGTNSFTPSITSTPTRTGTNSFTPSTTSTPTRTGTNSFTPSITSTPTRTGTNSFTPSTTRTLTQTKTFSQSNTRTNSRTPTGTSTTTWTPSGTPTLTRSPSSSATLTLLPTPTQTATSTKLPTWTPNWTSTMTETPTPTQPSLGVDVWRLY